MDSDANKKPVRLKVKEDGVYLQIDRRGGQKILRTDIMLLVESNKVKDIDFAAVNDIFKNEEIEFEALISYNTDVFIRKEEVKINVSQDKLMATITFVPPVNSESLMTFDDLKNYLSLMKIEYGIDERDLYSVFSSRVYDRPYIAAKGLPPMDGVDGYLVYHFDTSKKTYRPKTLEDGTVDYKQLNLIDVINENDKLIEGIPPVEGSDGMSVHAKPIPHKKGKPYPSILKTKNTRFSEDGRTLYAACSGQLVYKNGRVEVFPVLQISKNVDNTVGNIDFVGSVVIAGNVLTGFSVKAQGNIEIRGVLEGGEVIAGENVILFNGAQGVEKATIMARGDIHAKYIDQCSVYAGGNIYADFIIYSRVKSGGRIELSGKRGLLLGGRATVKEKIVATTIGANLAASTEIELGFMPDDFEKFREIMKEYEEMVNEYEKLERVSNQLNAQAEKGMDVEQMKAQNLYSKSYFEDKMEVLKAKIDDMTPDCSNEEICIIVSKTIHSGVKITIGMASSIVFENTKSCKIRNENDKIEITEL